MKTEWISVKDKLPDFSVRVLCLDSKGKIIIAQLSEIKAIESSTGKNILHEWFENKSYDYYYDSITHWMPLPEPPKNSNP